MASLNGYLGNNVEIFSISILLFFSTGIACGVPEAEARKGNDINENQQNIHKVEKTQDIPVSIHTHKTQKKTRILILAM